jgi:uncharacterized membrane-anchored protein
MYHFRLLPLFLSAFCLATRLAQAAESGASKERSFLENINWTKGPAKAELKSLAEVQVPEGFLFTGSKGTQELLEKMGNPTSGTELGFLAPTSLTWFVVFRFSDVGYVKDDDKDKLDANKLLNSIKEGTEAANKYREKMGAAPLHITGWEIPPRYNEQSHNLEWAIRGESEGSPVINYNTRLLGRKGVMEVKWVGDPEIMSVALPEYQSLLTNYSYKQGERYAEYRSGDKLAKYGLAALITGGAAAVAVKTGLFASLILFFKKAAKFIVIAVVAVLAWVKKLISGGRKSQESSQ